MARTISLCVASLPLYSFFFYCPAPHPDLHSFPTRRSSDLLTQDDVIVTRQNGSAILPGCTRKAVVALAEERPLLQDRKSTRLNSSHVSISYAVFCLKKKKKKKKDIKQLE